MKTNESENWWFCVGLIVTEDLSANSLENQILILNIIFNKLTLEGVVTPFIFIFRSEQN